MNIEYRHQYVDEAKTNNMGKKVRNTCINEVKFNL